MRRWRLVVERSHERHAALYEVVLRFIGGDFEEHDEIRGVAGCGEHAAPLRGLVARTLVVRVFCEVDFLVGLEQEHGHLVKELFGKTLVDKHSVPVEARALQLQPVYVHAVFRLVPLLLALRQVGHLYLNATHVDRDHVLAREVLERAREEGGLEEEPREPELLEPTWQKRQIPLLF